MSFPHIYINYTYNIYFFDMLLLTYYNFKFVAVY